MTQTAIAKLRAALIPATVYLPDAKTGTWDTPQRSGDRYVGYRALWLRVVIRATFDWVSYRDSLKMELRKEAERAHRWLFEKSELFNSFENVCHLVDLPPNALRAWAKALTKERVAKIEHLERDSSSPMAVFEAERRLIAELAEVDEDA